MAQAFAPSLTIELPDPGATIELAERLAGGVRPRDLIALSGPLGAGKSFLARALIGRLTGETEVPSPTFTLVQTYDTAAGTIWHLDLYRLRDPEEIWELGFEDALIDGIVLMEWPERLDGLLPKRRLDLTLTLTGPESRRAVLAARGGSDLLDRMAS
ncbi:MAG TPA: tRNA (adenosine(37)-N6)-threonylcarbamoyltransferase complex ATPase subunit type 1 TsaE [Aliidongia sp.]|nr:tRNA (adenosine(37)-N6)-threonylcarbamoyltransferase complex ATPase subunit type 1 TsaE [Aliidongia sp.]